MDLDRLILRLVFVGIVVIIAGIVFVFLLRRLAVVVDVDQGTFILFLVLGEFDVVAEFKSALVIRPVYLCLLRIDGYVIAGNGDLIADRCANNVVSIYIVKCCTDSDFCRSACLDTRRTDSILALIRREDGDIAAGLGNNEGVVTNSYFRIRCSVQDRDRTGHCEIGSACRCSGH